MEGESPTLTRETFDVMIRCEILDMAGSNILKKAGRKTRRRRTVNCMELRVLRKRKKAIKTQKQPPPPPRGALGKRCSENMKQIYSASPMPKCDFNGFYGRSQNLKEAEVQIKGRDLYQTTY